MKTSILLTNAKRLAVAIARYRRSPAARGLAIVLAGAITAIACGWSLITDHSVRFNAYRTGRGFYRLPPLPMMYDKTNGREISVQERENWYRTEDWELTDDESPTLSDKTDQKWTQVRAAIEEKNVLRARDLLTSILEDTDPPLDVADDERTQLQAKRNAARDMLDAMSALQNGSKPGAVSDYLLARLDLDQGSGIALLSNSAAPSKRDSNLLDNWEYLHGAKLYISGDKEKALEAFKTLVRNYPRSEKNEASLYMVAKITMELSHAFQSTACGIEGNGKWGQPVDPASVEPKEKCQDEKWLAAVSAFKQLMHKYPNGRYFNDSRGWLAYLYRRGGERAHALAEYYRMLGHSTDWAVRLEGKRSLQIIGHEYDDATLDKLEELIAGDVNAAMAYSYHRIYNHAVDLTYVERVPWCCSGDNQWQAEQDEKKRVTDSINAGNHELERVARFAISMMKQYPQAAVSGGFLLRVAQAQLELQNFNEARELAQKALRLQIRGDLRAEALWIKGSAEHQLKSLVDASRSFRELLAEFPKSKFTEGARRLLAMTAEDRGDLESALEQYLALDYKYDVAYYVDVYLPTDRLAKFVQQRPAIPQHNELIYALAVRYMRDRRWSEARETLMKVRTESVDLRYDFGGSRKEDTGKDPVWGEEGDAHIVRNNWVMRDLKTIDVLEQMERAIESSPDDETKAEAAYQMGSYLFEADDLLFYNPAAWKGLRSELLLDLQFGKQLRLSDESQRIFEHSQSHDTFARAIPIYLDIANRFPSTRAAKDALYSAAVAHERLSSINNYWRRSYALNLFAGPRLVSYADVKSAYPRYQLPRGTNGWEPSTRTVNGGPGWAARPKPLPRETKEQKIKRLLKEAANSVSEKLLPKLETKVDTGINWYRSSVEAALYGVLSGIGLWLIALIGIGLHGRRKAPEVVTKSEEPVGADSRVDKLIG